MGTTATPAPSAPAKTSAPPSRLAMTKAGKIRAGLRMVFYGSEAVGKSSLAAAAPSPIFIDVENGTGELDVPRYMFRDEPAGYLPQSLDEVYAAIRDLRSSPHEYKTLVIDTIDRLEPMLWARMIGRDSGKRSGLNQYGAKLLSIESYGFGKGYNVAVDEWRALAAELDDLRINRGMSIVLLGHAAIRTFKNPLGEDYDRWHLRINEKAAAFVKEWCDVVGFCMFEETGARLDESDDRTRAKGVSTGRRLMKLERSAAYDAKSRIVMPREVELRAADPWGPFAAALAESERADAPSLERAIGAELERINDAELTVKVRKAITDAKGNVATLSRFVNELRHR